MPTEKSNLELFIFWLRWVLLNTLAWVASWAVMKYVLRIHPEHPSSWWFFLIGFFTILVGEWWVFKKIVQGEVPEDGPTTVSLKGLFVAGSLFSKLVGFWVIFVFSSAYSSER